MSVRYGAASTEGGNGSGRAARRTNVALTAVEAAARLSGTAAAAKWEPESGSLPMSPPMGVSTVFFMGSAEGQIPPEELRVLAGSCVSCVEVIWHHEVCKLTPSLVSEYARVLADIGVRCHSLHAPFWAKCNTAAVAAAEKQSTRDTYTRSIDYLRVLNGRLLVVHPSAGAIPEQEHVERLEHAIESLAWLAGECEPGGVAIAVENLHGPALGRTAAELDRLIDAMDTDGAGVCLDVAHAHLTGGAAETIRALRNPVTAVHLCDNTRPDVERTCWPLQPQGLSDWNEVLRALRTNGYDGVMMYETYNDGRPDRDRGGLEQLERNYRELMRIWRGMAE